MSILDVTQPVYSSAAVWVEDRQASELEEAILRFRTECGVQMPELKGGKLLKSNPGRKLLMRVIKHCAEEGVEVCVVVQHKAFMAAAAVVEDASDPMYNEAFDSSWDLGSSKKAPLAEELHTKVSDAALAEWWEARRGGDLKRFGEAHARLVREVRLVESEVGLAAKLARADLGLIIEDPTTRIRGTGFSPNATTFNAILQCIHYCVEDKGVEKPTLIHDEQSEFEDEFRRAHEILLSGSSQEVKLEKGKLAFGTKNLGELLFKDSASSIPLQVADCIASVTRRVVELLESPRDPIVRQFQGALQETAKVSKCERSPWAIGPESWWPKAIARLLGEG